VIVLVGGQCRKAGKTSTICDLIAVTRDRNWIAYKLSPHIHTGTESADPDTARYLRAGAAEAHLLTALPPVLPANRNIIVESNSALEALRPDRIVFVASEGAEAEWKPSAKAVSERAGLTVTGRPTPEQLAQFVRWLSSSSTP
jgi:molybdopterin-guanine dinucleotide biosynthesis protein